MDFKMSPPAFNPSELILCQAEDGRMRVPNLVLT